MVSDIKRKILPIPQSKSYRDDSYHTSEIFHLRPGKILEITNRKARDMTDKEMLDEKDRGLLVLFKSLPELPPALKQHQRFLRLYSRLIAIDAEIGAATSKRARLRVVTQTSAVHLTCLKQAKRIAEEQEIVDRPNSRTWLKAIVVIAERATEVFTAIAG